MKILIFLSLFFWGCVNNAKSERTNVKQKASAQIDIFGNKLKKLPVRGVLSDKSQIKSWLVNKYFKGKQIQVGLVKTFTNFNVFRVEINSDIPNNIPKYYTFIHALEENSSFLLPIDFNQAFGIDNDVMFGGIYNYREYDYYFIYKFEKGILDLVFDSRKTSGTGIKIGYYRDDDCIEYYPNRLDFNFDGKRSISFEGTVKKFCKDGSDRNPKVKNPIIADKVTVKLDYIGKSWIYSKKSNYRSW